MPEFALDLFSDDLPDTRAQLAVRFEVERRRLIDYAVILRVWEGGSWANVRLYDHAHGHPEMHRYTSSGSKWIQNLHRVPMFKKDSRRRRRRSAAAGLR
jgi:hypothetical protein